MQCEVARLNLGRFLDRELPDDLGSRITHHLSSCSSCREELDSLEALESRLASPPAAAVPSDLWEAIDTLLERPSNSSLGSPVHTIFKRRMVVAASLLFIIGLGLITTVWPGGASEARAETVDFGLVLDALHLDPNLAFNKFLVRYEGREIAPAIAGRAAPELNFAIPATLAVKYELDSVFALQFGIKPGVAATYRHRETGQLLATVFHATVHPESFGTHEDYECVVGTHHGHSVRVGEWTMVHMTDPTTCHCVLSTLDESNELPAVLSSIAPGS